MDSREVVLGNAARKATTSRSSSGNASTQVAQATMSRSKSTEAGGVSVMANALSELDGEDDKEEREEALSSPIKGHQRLTSSVSAPQPHSFSLLTF
jgi:hypothetical protein